MLLSQPCVFTEQKFLNITQPYTRHISYYKKIQSCLIFADAFDSQKQIPSSSRVKNFIIHKLDNWSLNSVFISKDFSSCRVVRISALSTSRHCMTRHEKQIKIVSHWAYNFLMDGKKIGHISQRFRTNWSKIVDNWVIRNTCTSNLTIIK